MWFSSQSKKTVKRSFEQVEEISILKYNEMPSMSLLKSLFGYENTISATPCELTNEILKRINPEYHPKGYKPGVKGKPGGGNGMVAFGGEGAVLHVETKEKDVCVKIVRPELNITQQECPNDAKPDDWVRYQEALGRFKERFHKGIQNQRFLVSEARSENVLEFDFPSVIIDSIDLENQIVDLKSEAERLDELVKRTVYPGRKEELKTKREEIRAEIKRIRPPFIYMVMEWIDGPLILSRLTEKKDVLYSLGKYCDLLDSIQFVHSKNIIHRDLKSSNVLICGRTEAESKIAVVDWTFSKRKGDDQNVTLVGEGIGTAPYASPQQLALGNAIRAGIQDDICSLGFMLIEFFYAIYLPTPKKDDLKNFTKRQAYISSCARCLPEQLRPIFVKSTEFDKEKRYRTVEELKTDLIEAIKDIHTNGFECLEIRDPAIYLRDVIEKEIPIEDEFTIVDRELTFDLCEKCEYNTTICKKYKLCNQSILALQELKKEGYL